MGGFNLLEAACRRLVAAERQLLMGEKRQDALKAHVCPASVPAGGGSPFFLSSWTDNNLITTYHQTQWLPRPYSVF